jgi:hypothetical protein
VSKPAAIQGSLVDAKNVAAHKCVRLSIDVPAELAKQVIDAFGWPTMAEPVPVAIARLNVGTQAQEPTEKKRWHELPPSQQAAIRCNEPAFTKFLEETKPQYGSLGEHEVAEVVRMLCGVDSRKDIRTGTQAAQKWFAIDSEYQAWMRAG